MVVLMSFVCLIFDGNEKSDTPPSPQIEIESRAEYAVARDIAWNGSEYLHG